MFKWKSYSKDIKYRAANKNNTRRQKSMFQLEHLSFIILSFTFISVSQHLSHK